MAGVLTPTTKAELQKALRVDTTVLDHIPEALPDVVERFQRWSSETSIDDKALDGKVIHCSSFDWTSAANRASL